jgi:hypothetical protein
MEGDSFSSSILSSERSLPPMLSPRISLSLSNEVALHHPVIANPAIVALRIATAKVEEWPRGKAPGGSTVGSTQYDKNRKKTWRIVCLPVTCRSRIKLRSLEILSVAEIRTDGPDVARKIEHRYKING